MQIKELYLLFLKYPKITTDTRKDIKDSIFFCLHGDNFDGNKFAHSALDKKAAYVIIDDKEFLIKDDSRIILVDDTLETLQQLANYHRKQFTIPIIGITGTNGKTTTKELINVVLKKKYTVTSTLGNFNNHIGVPLTLLQLSPKSEIGIIEMGANHPDEIEFLCKIAEPTLGIITNIGKAHLEGFGSLDTIKRTKLALYRSVKGSKGLLFVNGDDELLTKESAGIETLLYGMSSNNGVFGQVINEFPFLELEWSLQNQNKSNSIASKLFGRYNFTNIMAAVAVGNYFDITPDNISLAIASYLPTNNRSQFIKGNNNELIMDAYNANPASLEIALANFHQDQHPNKACILGDMFELGQYALEEHNKVLEDLMSKKFQTVVLVGPLFKSFESLFPTFKFYENTTALINEIASLKLIDKRILIKGSRGIKLEVLFDYIN